MLAATFSFFRRRGAEGDAAVSRAKGTAERGGGEATKYAEKNESGQAMIEFIMLIPLIMAFVWYMVHVNMAINKSIVGQKHARSQLFLKLYNHRSGPVANEFGRSERSHFYIGVSGEPVQGTSSTPAPTEMLGIGMSPSKNTSANDDPGDAEPGSLRQRVRIRTAFGICTHRKRLRDGSGLTDFCGSTPAGSD